MPCDSTTSLDKWLIKTKLTGPMDGALLDNKEFVFGHTELSLYVKDPVTSDIYQFGRIFDSTSVTVNNVWSSEYTKNYIDNNLPTIDLPVKSMLLTAGGLNPTPTNGCSDPYIDENNDVPKVMADFDTTGTAGFWNIAVPGDYTGVINKITVLYTGPTNECNWAIEARVLADNTNINSGGSWSTTYNLTDTPESSNTLQKVELSSTINLFGNISNVGNFATVRIRRTSGTGTFSLLQVKFEY